MTVVVEEVPTREASRVAAALLALKVHLGSEAALADRVDRDLRPLGYRVAGAFERTAPPPPAPP